MVTIDKPNHQYSLTPLVSLVPAYDSTPCVFRIRCLNSHHRGNCIVLMWGPGAIGSSE